MTEATINYNTETAPPVTIRQPSTATAWRTKGPKNIIYPGKTGLADCIEKRRCFLCGKPADENGMRGEYLTYACSCGYEHGSKYFLLMEREPGEDSDPVKLTGRYYYCLRDYFNSVYSSYPVRDDVICMVSFPAHYVALIGMEAAEAAKAETAKQQDKLTKIEQAYSQIDAENERLKRRLDEIAAHGGEPAEEATDLKARNEYLRKQFVLLLGQQTRAKNRIDVSNETLRTCYNLLQAAVSDIQAATPEERRKTEKQLQAEIEKARDRGLKV